MSDEQDQVEGEGKPQDDVKTLIAEAVAVAIKPFQSQLETDKAEIAGLNRKNSELEKEKAELEKSAQDKVMTVEERLKAVEEREQKAARERESERRAAEIREKQLTWKSEASKRKLPDSVYVDPTLSPEEGVAYLDSLQETLTETVKAEVNAAISTGHKPGSGGVGGTGAAAKGWNELTPDEAIARAEKEMDAGT